MNILLTGGAGYIGSHTAVVLSEAGHEVIVLDNFCNSQKSVLNRLKKILNKDLICIEGDIRSTALVTKVLKENNIDAVIHFAGLKAVGESVLEPIKYYANNIQGTISLLEAMKEADVKKIVFSSSATVYGNPQYLPIDELHATSATNPYGRSKLHIEEMLKDVADSDPNWRVMCLRYFNPVGSHESGLIFEDPKGPPNNLMPYLQKVISGELPVLNIYGSDYPTPDGTGVRDYIHVVDLAEGHLAALKFLNDHLGWHAINLGTGVGHSVLEIISAAEACLGKKIPHQRVSRRSGDIAICFSDINKAKIELNWVSRRSPLDIFVDDQKK